MDITAVINAIVSAFARAMGMMQSTFVFHVGTISVSVFDMCIAGLVIDLLLYICFPWFGGDDDD